MAQKVMHEVPEFIEEVKNAPLNKKQEMLTKGVKTLWKDFNDGMKGAVRARKKKAATRKAKKSNGKAGVVKVSAKPETKAADLSH